MSAEKINRKTVFKSFRVQKARVCAGCRDFIVKGVTAWKAAHGGGGWTADAVLCATCVNEEK